MYIVMQVYRCIDIHYIIFPNTWMSNNIAQTFDYTYIY